jgi:hypothetical protein
VEPSAVKRRKDDVQAGPPVTKEVQAGPSITEDVQAGPPVTTEEHQFKVIAADQCETSRAAFADVAPILRKMASLLGMPPTELRIYDPYYCRGAVTRHFNSLGFPAVYNRNEDFYQVQKSGKGPEHDVLVTNPVSIAAVLTSTVLTPVCTNAIVFCVSLTPESTCTESSNSAAPKTTNRGCSWYRTTCTASRGTRPLSVVRSRCTSCP